MTTDEKIEFLLQNPPTVRLTGWQRAQRVVGWVTACVAALSLVLGVVNTARTAEVVACTNANLGTRQVVERPVPAIQRLMLPPMTDTAVNIYFIGVQERYDDVINKALAAPPKTEASRVRLHHEFVLVQREKATAERVVKWQLVANQAFRTAHPLGEC